jgi:hypothetical protein
MRTAKIFIINAIVIAKEKNKLDEVVNILKNFIKDPGNLDIETMCDVEYILNEDIIIINPTPTQIRKCKLSEIYNVENNISVDDLYDDVSKFIESYNSFILK